MAKTYTISDGRLVLELQDDPGGGFVVTSPLDPELITQGESIGECFENARDAMRALRSSRRKAVLHQASHKPGRVA